MNLGAALLGVGGPVWKPGPREPCDRRNVGSGPAVYGPPSDEKPVAVVRIDPEVISGIDKG